jgi:hypothetical protein
MKLSLAALIVSSSLVACTLNTSIPNAKVDVNGTANLPGSTGRSATEKAPAKTDNASSVGDEGIPENKNASSAPPNVVPGYLTITASLQPNQKPTTSPDAAGNSIVFGTANGDEPKLDPAPSSGALPAFGDDSVITIGSPGPGPCQPQIELTYNTTQIGIAIQATDDDATAGACKRWLGEVEASGLDLTVTNVSWAYVSLDSDVRSTVRIKVTQ